MAVQIPKVDRFQPQQTPSVGRSELNAPNAAAIAQPQMNAVLSIAEQQTAYIQKQEDNAIDTAATAAANEYEIYLNKELSNARTFQGDPTFIYSQLDKSSEKKFEEILNKNPNLSGRGKELLNDKLSEVKANYKMKKDTAYAGQYYEYDKKVTEDSVVLTAQRMMAASSYINPENEKTFRPMDALINRIGNLYKTHGEKFGAVTRDENKNQIATDSINLQIAKATSEGLVATINNLNDSGRPDLADAVYAKYSKFIDIKKKDDLSKAIRKEYQEVKVLNAVNDTVGMDSEKIDVYLDMTFKDDLQAKEKAYEAIDARSRRQINIKNRISDDNYNKAFDIVSKRMNSDMPYIYASEIENDPSLKKILPYITKPSQKKALQQMINSPSKSDEDVYNKNLEYSINGGYAGMTPAKFREETVGLKDSHRRIFESEFKKQHQDTESAQRSRTNDAWNKLYRKFENGGFIKKKEGRLTKSSQEFLTRVQTKFLQSTDSYTKNMSPKDIDSLNNQIYDEEVKTRANQPKSWLEQIRSWWSDKNGNADEREIDRKPYKVSVPNSPIDPNASKSVPKSSPAPSTDPKSGKVTANKTGYTMSAIQNANDAFVKEKGRPPESSAELKAYMKEKGL